MVRVNLSLDVKLFEKISEQAKAHNVSANAEIISILENIFNENPFNLSFALTNLIDEAQTTFSNGEEFLLNQLHSFQAIDTGKISDTTYRYVPKIQRARLGTAFKIAVANGTVPNVTRAKDDNGEDKAIRRTAIYKFEVPVTE